MKGLWCAVAILAAMELLAGPARAAGERPSRYDVDGHCRRLANTPDGFSPEAMQRCLMAQNDSLDQIKRVWAGTPEYIRNDCDQRSRAHGEGDYAALERCIHDQLRQAPPDVALPTVR